MSCLDMYVDGAVASVCATLVSNPFDVMRTRMQLQGELCKRGTYRVEYRNMAQGMLRVVREEGWRALYKGLTSAVIWQVLQNGFRVGLFPAMQAELSHTFGSDAIYVSVIAGATCGMLGSIVSCPFQMVKTRLQSQRNIMKTLHDRHLSTTATGEQYDYTGVRDALCKIYKQGGLRGLWRGCSIAAQRTMVGSASQLTVYDLAKMNVSALTGWAVSDIRVHICAATFSAVGVVVFMNPLDVVMTRSFNCSNGKKVYSSNLAAATRKVWRVEGFSGLYKGSLALFSRSAPHNIATFVTLEYIRKFREKYTNRSYTSGSQVGKSIGFHRFEEEPDATNESSVQGTELPQKSFFVTSSHTSTS